MTSERYYSYEIYPYDRGEQWVANLMFGPTVIDIKTAWTLKGAHRKGRRMARRANRRLKKERAKR